MRYPKPVRLETAPTSPDKSGCTTYQGDLGNFTKVGVIGKRLLISLIYHK